MKRVFAAVCFCLIALASSGRADAPLPSLQMTSAERGFFQLGCALGRASFGYADLAHQAGQIARSPSGSGEVARLAALAPIAQQSRATARAGFRDALAEMQTLHAPVSALRPVQAATSRLEKPIVLAGDARSIALFSNKAAETLGTLDEYDAVASVPENSALQHWLTSPAASPAAHVWFAEGLISTLAIVAAKMQRPDLLPPVKEIATDLRGLRDWLTLRLPDTSTDDQATLETAIDDFLRGASRVGLPPAARLDTTQLAALGDISRRLQAQVSRPAPAAPQAHAAPF